MISSQDNYEESKFSSPIDFNWWSKRSHSQVIKIEICDIHVYMYSTCGTEWKVTGSSPAVELRVFFLFLLFFSFFLSFSPFPFFSPLHARSATSMLKHFSSIMPKISNPFFNDNNSLTINFAQFQKLRSHFEALYELNDQNFKVVVQFAHELFISNTYLLLG